MDEDGRNRRVRLGCLAIVVAVFAPVFFFMARSLAFALTPAFPFWVATFIAILVTFTVMGIVIALPGDVPDKLVRLVIVVILYAILLPAIERAVRSMSPQKTRSPEAIRKLENR